MVAICLRRFEAGVKIFPHISQVKYLCQPFVSFESHTIFQYTAKRGYKQRLSSETQMTNADISEEFEGPHGHDTLEKCFLHVNYALKRFLVNTP